MKSTDPRKLRSKSLLRDALVQLMHQKNANAISIRELTEKAQVNRSTFYLHYFDMPDFLHSTIDEVLDGLIEYVSSHKPFTPGIDGKQENIYYTKYFEYIQTHADFFRMMLGDNGLPEFRRKLVENGTHKYTQLMSPHQQQLEEFVSLPVLAQYIISAHVGLVEYWLDSGMKYSATYMARQITTLSLHGPLNIADIKDKIDIPQ